MNRPLLPTLRGLMQTLVSGAGQPRVRDEDGVRSLRFGDGVVQSSMCLSDPFALELSYTRAMMGFVLFSPEPRTILLVGLGGGSLSKYCYRQFPQAQITTVEVDPAVIALRDRFFVPPDDQRFRVVPADARDYLAGGDGQADVLLLDGYDAAGLPEDLCAEPFYSRCRQALGTHGVLVANLWGGEPNRVVYLDRLRRIFDDRVWWSRPHGSTNLIVFALKGGDGEPRWSQLMTRAQTLERRYHLDLPQLARALRERPDPDG